MLPSFSCSTSNPFPLAHTEMRTFRGLVHFPKSEVARKIRWAQAQFENPIRAGTTEGVKKGEKRRSICDGACRRQGDGLKRRRYPENNGDWHGRPNHKKKTCFAWRKNTNKMQQYRWFIVNCRYWLLTTVSTCFGQLYAHHQEKRSRVTAYGVYLLVVLDVAGCGTVVLRCRVWALWRLLPAATFTVLTPYNVTSQNRNLPHPTLPANTLHMQ